MTLIEVLSVAGIIGLLAAMAVPFFVKARSNSEDAAFINDLRVAVSGFVTYSVSEGGYPGETVAGVLPTGMSAHFSRRLRWTEPTPIGGQWDWDYQAYGFKAGVSVFQPVRTPSQMRDIDRKIDDGDLSTGSFRTRAGGGYVYIIEP
jgi:type II secretory pathway pseudopilin PulG